MPKNSAWQEASNVPNPHDLTQLAFERLASRSGFKERAMQTQLALLIADGIEGKVSSAIEAPTGLGKSLAALVPAISHAICSGKRTMIATYTNVLAEQYWRSDLPLALSLFDDEYVQFVKARFLMGKQRYICLYELENNAPDCMEQIRNLADLGIESEFMAMRVKTIKERRAMWRSISAPMACAGKACPLFDDCFFFKARREATDANIIITNHSIALMDAIQGRARKDGEEVSGFLGNYDYLIVDEAHDFYTAAVNSLEFEISLPKLNMIQGVVGRLQRELGVTARQYGQEELWIKLCEGFRDQIEEFKRGLIAYRLECPNPGILVASPIELEDNQGVKRFSVPQAREPAERLSQLISQKCKGFEAAVSALMETWKGISRQTTEVVRNYLAYIEEFGWQCSLFLLPTGVSVSYASLLANETKLRQDLVAVDEPLREILWSRRPATCLSATLALDQRFDFFEESVGFEPLIREVLPSPFDFASQAALYVPPAGTIPDPSQARKDGRESEYYYALAQELKQIITIMGGRTLALFHSRREMEGVYQQMALHPDFPLMLQPRFGAQGVGEQFKRKPEASLFALRSFWTGFDAPGETLSCVVIVRVPFEVPVEPPSIVRVAHLQGKGEDPFAKFTLPMAKMMVRQGVGRLIRRDEDRGIIALLDPRLTTKRYGPEILENLPPGMRTFSDFGDAAAWVGLAT